MKALTRRKSEIIFLKVLLEKMRCYSKLFSLFLLNLTVITVNQREIYITETPNDDSEYGLEHF